MTPADAEAPVVSSLPDYRDDDLGGKVAVVTGAASGIGYSIAARLHAAGMQVMSVDADAASQAPGHVHQADLTDAMANAHVIETAMQRFGQIDLVVANAGMQHVAGIEEFPVAKWETLIALMLTSPFLLAKHAWPALRAAGAGRFIVIASVHGLVASPYKAAYVSAKHGVVGLVKTLALEGAEDGITAVAVCPGYVRTPLVEQQIRDQARVYGIPEESVLEDVILASQPVKKMIEPAEVAELVAFLAGPAGRSFSGAPVTMDWGWTAR